MRIKALFVAATSGLLALVAFSGCTTVQVTDDQIAELRLGELQGVVSTSFAAAYDATHETLEQQGLFVTGDDRKVVEAVIHARDRQDTRITVKLKEVAVGQTSVKIRYGATGDAARSQALYRAIAEKL